MKNAWKDFGIDVSYEILNYGMGTSKFDHIRTTQSLLRSDKVYRLSIEKLLKQAEYHTIKELRKNPSHSDLFGNLGERFKNLQKEGYRIGHTTGYTYNMVEPILEHWKNVYNYVPNAVITSDEVKKGRPYPDAIIKCSERMLVPLYRCINIDDSSVGIIAGNNAKIPSFGVYQYGNWRGPLIMQHKRGEIIDPVYYSRVYEGIVKEYEKMKLITEHAYPTTEHVLDIINSHSYLLEGKL